MKSFKSKTGSNCIDCVHWMELEKQHSSRKTGYCRKIGNKPSLFDKWDVTYADDTCNDFKNKRNRK